ncbi:MAG: hypothetical protein A2Y45_04265 [Tenericutes bacterium GWC2_34_14]|nr:MAG: hypothetical protein A2Z84_08160 [Tenericutes bacterium GWA2_35_7]OHE28816.1 MAG: hypothetical protein A2Y45_04265 [Tenericutes bacterium GWC2_34_14]OHE33284.1 MAG: hypothetical protein A2012_06045 [Tenericutes bacterium GWE2_34_108]OHE36434.1 MAG: hypothetical protein A2Y46_08150 [Tenericutes bacterium GWF1_35_14]OHE37638.1 MAG: hypothetical protein A2Y44_03075 [Tenericutes bacterium GWF2_35_184]OHE45085.1 MAG: hypothetical protein A2221_02435 [Tenericutes bacterium RIFOXYA2_FULL_36_3
MKSLKIAWIVLLLSGLLSMFVLMTPVPKRVTETQFSAAEAAKHIEVISREPHSVFDPEAHEEVRLYLKETLEGMLGLANVTEMNYTKEELGMGTDYDIKNLLAVIQGKSDTGILLVGHYDSRGHVGRDGELGRSYGAADDGYALGTMLEIARLYANQDLENSIYLLFTDAEETGLYGAYMAAQEPFMDKIGFVINIEARGVSGPAYMFETSVNNDKVIDFYQHTDLKVSYSLATAVYTVMPNSTDFTEFLNVGKQGINFAVLEGLYYYHTPMDKYDHIEVSSIQHYGEQIVPLVETFTKDAIYSDVNYFVGEQNQVFFTILPDVFIAYRESTMHIFQWLTFVLFLAITVYLILKNNVAILSILKYIGLMFVSLGVFAVIGLYLAKLVAFIGRVPFSIIYVRMEGTELPTLLLCLGLIVGVYVLYKRFVKKEEDQRAVMIAGIFLNLLLAILTGYTLSGASFLFFVPALFGVISLIVITFIKHKFILHIALSQNILWNMLLVIPIVYSLFLAITVGGLLAFFIIIFINLTVSLPYFRKQLSL